MLQGQAKDAATALANKVSLLLYAHLLRIVPSDPKLADEQAIIVERSTHLIGGMLQISQSRNWMSMTLGTLDVAQVRHGMLNGVRFLRAADLFAGNHSSIVLPPIPFASIAIPGRNNIEAFQH